MSPMFKRVRGVGRRGACLTILGVLDVVIGWSTLGQPPETYDKLLIVKAMTPTVWGVVQVIMGLVVLLYVMHPSGRDKVGFQVALIPPTVWGLAGLYAGFVGDLPLALGLRSGLVWFGYATLILILSGMVGIEEVKQEARKDHHRDSPD